MDYMDIIKSELPNMLDAIENEIQNDESIYEFIDKSEISWILQKQKELLYKFFIEYGDEHIDESLCWHFYKELDIPFAVVYRSLNSLKINLLKKMPSHIKDKQELLEINGFIDNLLNIVAKIYIRKDISNIDTNTNSKFEKYLLFKAHAKWIDDLSESIRQDDLSLYPLVSAQECPFEGYLEYPESLMVCMDANLCSYLHDIHQIIHKNANTLYLFYSKKEYYQAYLAYKELFQNIMNFNKTILELYFLAYNNLEDNFFRLVELLLYRRSDINLTLIDIKGLKKLNTNYGELAVNKILDEIDKKLQYLVHDREEDVLLIRGVTADYYMLNIGLSKEELSELNKKLYSIVNTSYKIKTKDISVNSTIVTLLLKEFYEKNRDDLTKLMLYLKDEAKTKTGSYNIDSRRDRSRLTKWLNRSYQDIDFVSDKINTKQIDIAFQPIFNISSGKAEILEALVRIVDGNRLIPAGVFIDTIYSIDKIELLDRIVLEKLMEKKDTIKRVAPTLFINVSYRSLLDIEYQKSFKAFMRVFADHEVIFELTEQSIVENIDEILKINKKHNLNFAVDDFGSGYSSLKSVSDLAKEGVLKVLKMDGEIIKEIDHDSFTQKIVRVISELSTTLDLYSVAEFIESKEILDMLRDLNVTYAQGFYLSKPKSIEELLVQKLNGALDLSRDY